MELFDWSFEDPETIFRNINLMGHFYNFQRRTIWAFFNDIGERGFADTVADRMARGRLHVHILYRRHSLEIDITKRLLRIKALPCAAGPVKIGFRDQVFDLKMGQVQEFEMDDLG